MIHQWEWERWLTHHNRNWKTKQSPMHKKTEITTVEISKNSPSLPKITQISWWYYKEHTRSHQTMQKQNTGKGRQTTTSSWQRRVMGLGLTRDGVVGQIVSRSLKLMVWLILKCFTHKSFIPMKCFLNRWAQKRFEFPSKAKMMLSGAISGRTHTFFLHTPNPYDHVVFPTRELNIAC